MAIGAGAVFTAVGLLIAVAVHTAIAIVGIRFLRVRLATRWGPIIYALFLLPLVFVPTTVVFGAVLGTGDVTLDTQTLVSLLFVVPIGLGFAVDFFWLPAPEVVEVPAED
jgi:hypothetical protein